jgi:hypothetical protein
MNPVSPVFPKTKGLHEVVYAADQPEYLPLPAHRDNYGTVTARWHMSWRERLRVLFSGDIWLSILTFNRPLQPHTISATPPEVVAHSIEESGDASAA